MAKPAQYDTNVFINCPFDETYVPILESIVFTVIACGFTPCSALQERDAGAIRLEKIKRLIGSSRLGIHDISRTDVDVDSGLPRFNMPFELGIDIAACYFGKGHLTNKKILIFDKDKYRYQKFISDIAGQDISAHNDSYTEAIAKIRPWLNSFPYTEVSSPSSSRKRRNVFAAT